MMIRIRILTSACLLAGAVAMAQTPVAPLAPAAPPAPPAQAPVPPVPAVPAKGWVAPVAPLPPDWEPLMDEVRNLDVDAIELQAQKAAMQADSLNLKGMALDLQAAVAPWQGVRAGIANGAMPFRMDSMRVDNLYDRGQRDLDRHAYPEALDAFTQVASKGAAHADGALYWKAYTLDKLGRRDEALSAIADLRKSYASSRWLDDAKALEIQVKQDAGQKVSPDNQSDDDLKLLALNGLVQSDPDRAYPYLEKLLKSAQSPRLKRNALFVLAESNSPKYRQLLEQIARGGGNPDLQISAIEYMAHRNNSQPLIQIYNSSTDPAVKRAVIRSLANDKPAILQIAKTEKNSDLRIEAIRMLGRNVDQADLWQMYQSEQDPNVKRQILSMLSNSPDKLLEVARSDKDLNMRRTAVTMLGSLRTQLGSADALSGLYTPGTNAEMKRTIINALAEQHNVRALIAIARKEQDPEMKRNIVRRLVDMHSPEANQFLEEILK